MLGARGGVAVVDVDRRVCGETLAQVAASGLEQFGLVDAHRVLGPRNAAHAGTARRQRDLADGDCMGIESPCWLTDVVSALLATTRT